MPRKISLTTKIMAASLLLLAVALACGIFARQPDIAPVPPLEIPAAAPTVLAACDTSSQAKAMRPEHVPDWDALGLSACYELMLELHPKTHTYTGTAQVTLTNRTGRALPDLVFRAYPNAPHLYGGLLAVTAARVDGNTVATRSFLPDSTAIRLTLATPLDDGATAVVELEFMGDVPLNYGGSSTTYGIFNLDEETQVWALTNSYPLLAPWRDGAWYASEVLPVGDAVVSEAALYRVQITAPSDFHVAATGTRLEAETTGEQTAHTFVSGPVREFNVIASPNFIPTETEVDGIRVVHWGLPEGEQTWDKVLGIAKDSLTVFNEHFGAYPYNELDIVAVPLQLASGVEYPGLILVDIDQYTSPSMVQNFMPVVVAHEVAHQWWYGLVGSDVLAHPWQDESLTAFSSFLYFERYDTGFYDGMFANFNQTVAEFEAVSDEKQITQSLTEFHEQNGAYGVLVYTKGPLFFIALREEIGDEAFFAALQNYYTQYTYQTAPPEALLNAFEVECACNLTELYEAWGVVADN